MNSEKTLNKNSETVDASSHKKAANFAKLMYLGVIAFGILAEVIRTKLIVTDDATATANNILDSMLLFRLSFVSDLLMLVCFLLLGLGFFLVFQSFSKNGSLLILLLVSVSVPIQMLNMLNQFAIVQLLSNPLYLAPLSEAEIHAYAMMFLNLYKNGYLIAQIFFGAWLLPVGYLGIKSKYFPKIINILVIIGGTAMLVDTFMVFLFPVFYENIAEIFDILSSVGELGFVVWFWIKGAKFPTKMVNNKNLKEIN